MCAYKICAHIYTCTLLSGTKFCLLGFGRLNIGSGIFFALGRFSCFWHIWPQSSFWAHDHPFERLRTVRPPSDALASVTVDAGKDVMLARNAPSSFSAAFAKIAG